MQHPRCRDAADEENPTMNEPTLLELIREYGRQMDAAGRDDAMGRDEAGQSLRRGERLLDEIERRLRENRG
ncbi:hypothetical protein OHA01_26485 [Micromonospora zamorensis]|uniref:hypothetical protein n=1 Tax=Micromonospora zamorensis TaxID=709883 RepID=UPI00352AFBC5|nr:hypothetical protein OG423_13990 [Micromonospora zamorensis]WTE86071.1 hypothetical protein OHA01_26485 [Micromonospora zamorensis]